MADDEDIVQVAGTDLVLFFDGSLFGVPPALDLDALTWVEERSTYFLCYDGGGSIGDLRFDDQDVFAYELGVGWRMARWDRGSALPLGEGADLDALDAAPGLFADGFESGDTSRWSSTSG